MGMFSRVTDIINSNINSMLDKAEQPEKMIRMIITEMEETLVEVRSMAAKTIAEQKSLVRQIGTLDKQASNWNDKAQLAVEKGRDDLARAALIEKNNCQQQAQELQAQQKIIDENLMAIQNDSQRLQDKLIEARARQDSLKLRQKSATARLKVREQVASIDIDATLEKFERYQQRVESVEAQVEAYDLTASDLNAQFNQLAAQESIDAELSEMKKKVANG